MRILLVHQNYPGQFRHLAPALQARGHEVRALSVRAQPRTEPLGVPVAVVTPTRSSSSSIHPWVMDWETKIIRGEAAFLAAEKLRAAGWAPDLIYAHPGWGESLFLKEVWPRAKLALYCEFYYLAQGADLGFDPEFPAPEAAACRMRAKNVNIHMHFDVADAALAPTHWQASTFPQPFRDRIAVIHDGIDTARVAPRPDAVLEAAGRRYTRADELITFVNRNLEPQRGYHVFMRALPEILRQRPNAQVLIVGDSGPGYGVPPPPGRNWRDIYFDEVKDRLDPARVHFLGQLPYDRFVSLLQVSTVHVYLTYPFVLGWSLLEAMSAGCAIVASDTVPLHEAIAHDRTGRLVPFFDTAALAQETVRLLESGDERARLGVAARTHAQQQYDLQTVCLPQQLHWIEKTA